jgi:hypothetical protein
LVHRPGPARLAQTLSAKWFGNGSGFAVCGAGWLAKVLGIASGPVGEARFGVPGSWKGNGRFRVNFWAVASAVASSVSPLRRRF